MMGSQKLDAIYLVQKSLQVSKFTRCSVSIKSELCSSFSLHWLGVSSHLILLLLQRNKKQ